MSSRIVVEPKEMPSSKIAPLSQAVATKGGGRLLYLAGQIGFLPGTDKLAGLDIESQTRQTMINIGAILAAAGLTFDNVLNCTVLLADIRDIQRMNAVYSEFFAKPYPARYCFQAANLPVGARVEIVAVAELPLGAKL